MVSGGAAGRFPWVVPAALVPVFAVWAAAAVLLYFAAPRIYALALVSAALFPVALVASGNPRLLLLVGLVFTAPLGLSINFGRHIHAGGAASYAIDLADFFLLPLLLFLARDLRAGYRKSLRVSPLTYWWLALTAVGLVSVVFGPYRTFASQEIVRMVKCWLLFFVVLNECVRERHFQHVAVALGAGLVVHLVVAALQFLLKRTLGLEALGEPGADSVAGANLGVFLKAGSVYRVSGLLGHPNLFSTYLAMLVPYFVALLFTDYAARLKAFFAVLAGCGTAALIATLSRAGWVDFAAAMLVLVFAILLMPALRTRFPVLKVTMIGALAAGLAVAAGPIITRLTASDSGAVDFRFQWIKVAWSMVQDRPLLGHGLNTFSYQSAEHVPYSIPRMIELFGSTWPVVHNVYALVWAEQGTVGFLLFVGFMLHLIWLGLRHLRRCTGLNVYMAGIGAFCAVVAVTVDGLASYYLRVPAPARVFWIMAAILVASVYWSAANAPRRRAAPDPTPPADPGGPTGEPRCKS